MNVIVSGKNIGDIFYQIQTEVTAIKAKRVSSRTLNSLTASGCMYSGLVKAA